MIKTMENTATARQRWALYCITKKDYRNEILSKEEAAKLIQELGDPNYKKTITKAAAVKPTKTVKPKAKSIDKELLDYLKANINELYNDCLQELGYETKVSLSCSKKPYTFIGTGCGITWLKYRKNNKRAEAINEAARKYRLQEVEQMLIKKLPKKIYKELNAKGCPFEAIWAQMQRLQTAYWYMVAQFAKTKGIEMIVESYMD